MTKFFLLCGALLVTGYWRTPERGVVHPPGVIAPNEPEQKAIDKPRRWKFGEHTITPLATFDMEARVLSTTHYWLPSRETRLSSYDFVVGWGRMSDQAVLDTMTITQSNRWFEWKWSGKRPPISDSEIASHAGNMHMIAADEAVLRKLGKTKVGQIVHIRGWLVRANSRDGWAWTSSLSRTDEGKGSCEVVWVEEISSRDE